MITFQKVRYKNFLSAGDEFVEIALNEDKTTIITGSNGAGKTTFVDAVLYALYNKPLKDIKLGELVNSVTKKKMVAEIEFIVNGSQYKIVRGKKPEVLEIHKDGEQIEQQASSRDIQAKIEKEILRTDYKTFLQVVVLASMKYKNFMDLDASSRRLVVENMLDLEIIGLMSKLLKDRIKEINNKSSKIDVDHRELSLKIENLNRLIEANKDTTKEQKEVIIGNIDNTNTEINNLNGKFEVYQLELDQLETQKPEINVEECSAKFKEYEELRKKLTTIRQEQLSKIAVGKNTVSTNNSKISFYDDNDKCSVCEQDLDTEFKNKIISDLKTDNLSIENSIEISRKHSNTAEEKLDLLGAKLNDLNEKANILKTWEYKVSTIKSQQKSVQNSIDREQTQLKRYEEQLNQLMESNTVNTDEYVKEIQEINSKIEELVKHRAEITEQMEIARLSGDVLKDNGVKAKIIKQYLPIINDSINYYLDKLGANYSFNLDEQFNQIIKSRYRDSFSYGAFSNGESTRINLAIVLMWRKLAESKNTVHTNLLIMDEVLDGALDKSGIDCVLSMFEDSSSDICVISHRHEIIDKFDRHIQVSKVGNFSKYDGLVEV